VNEQSPSSITKSRHEGGQGMLTEKNSRLNKKMMLLLKSKGSYRESKK
jgi:hypothetical protein